MDASSHAPYHQEAAQRVTDVLTRAMTPGLIALSALGARLRASTVALRSRLLPSNALAVNLAIAATLLTSLRVAGNYLLPRKNQLRQRRLLLTRVQQAVRRWECAVEDEVLYRCVGVSSQDDAKALGDWCSHRELADRLVDMWARTTAGAGSERAGPYQGIVASVAFASDFDLKSYIDLVYTAEQLLTAVEDRAWVRRLLVIVLFGIFRRLAVIEEARHFAALWRHYVLHGAGREPVTTLLDKGTQTHAPPAAWRVFGRPTWLVPLAPPPQTTPPLWSSTRSFRCYLGLPLAYFPVGAVLTYMCEETWLSPSGCAMQALPRWRKCCVSMLRDAKRAVSLVDLAESPWHSERRLVVVTKVSYLFLRYGHNLMIEQQSRAVADTSRFAREKLFCGALVTAPEQLSRSEAPVELLSDLRDTVPYEEPGSGLVKRDRTRERRVRTLTLACTVCSGVSALLDAVVPQLGTEDLICLAALSVFSRDASPGQLASSAGRNGPSIGHQNTGSPSSSTASDSVSAAERLAAQLAWHLVVSVVTGVAEVLILRASASFRKSLALLLSEELEAQLLVQLHAVDEAFYSRFIEEGHDGAPVDATAFQASSRETTQNESVPQLLKRAQSGGEAIVGKHCTHVRRVCRLAAIAGVSLYHREPFTAIVAYVMSLDVQTLLGQLTQIVGLSTVDDFASGVLYDGGEDTLPVDRPAGLSLLVELLADDHSRTDDASGSNSSRLAHPYLALIACSAVWQHATVVTDTVTATDEGVTETPARESAADALQHVKRIRNLYCGVTAHRYDARAGRFFGSLHTSAHVESMLLDAQCILAYPLEEQLASQTAATAEELPRSAVEPRRKQSTKKSGLSDGSPRLDEEEEQLIRSKAAADYVPSTLDYFDLFAAPTRFVLRQLGMEMVFAERTIAGLRQAAPRDASSELEELYSSASFNPLTWLFTDVAEALQAFLVIAASCGEWRNGCLHVRPTDPQRVYAQLGRLQRFRRLFTAERRSSAVVQQTITLRRLQQLCECLPSTVSDASPLSCSRDVVERRQAWAAWLNTKEGGCRSTRVDALGRVCGGLHARHGMSLHNVFFAYPQLHHSGAPQEPTPVPAVATIAATHKPVLCGATCHFLAAGMTAIIGPTGSGKSSTVALLLRHYDTLPPVCVAWPHALTDAEACWTDELLGRLLYLQAVDGALPWPPGTLHNGVTAHDAVAPSPITTSAAADTIPGAFLLFRDDAISGVRIDGMPISCLSTAYLRQWCAHLEQSPQILEKLSFFDNVRLLHTCVTYSDAVQAALMCRCAPFIKDKPQQLLHPTGTLSGGEQQRLALARVVAAIHARVRAETLSEPFTTSLQSPPSEGTALPPADKNGALHTEVDGVLVLDEPTSRLDAYNELQVLESVEKLASDSWGGLRVLIIAIAHRLSTLRTAQHVVVVENGHVTAEGSPREVVASNAFAKEQMRLQELS